MEHRSRLRPVGIIVVALLIAAMPIYADDTMEDLRFSISRNRFELWNACRSIRLLVERLPDDDVQGGLTHEAIVTTVRSRLRAARLYGEISTALQSYLYVNVNSVGGVGYNVRLAFSKPVSDPISGQNGLASTRTEGLVGQSRDAGFILSGVSRLKDRFIDEYLRVNEPACPRSPIDP